VKRPNWRRTRSMTGWPTSLEHPSHDAIAPGVQRDPTIVSRAPTRDARLVGRGDWAVLRVRSRCELCNRL
jgi:hypothetical protein